jgi:hypothetical protein
MPDESVTDFLVDQARTSEHVTALVLLLVKKGVITGPEYADALQTVVSARLLDAADPQSSGTNPLDTT